MKRLNIIALLLISLFAFMACDDEDNYTKLSDKDLVKSTLKTDLKDDIVVTKKNHDELAGTWEWTAANFGIESEINYQIVIADKQDLSNAQEVVVYTKSLYGKPQNVKYGLLNNAVQALLPENAIPDEMEEMTFYLAVKAYLGTTGELSAIFSEPVEFKFTPYPDPKPKPVLYVVGNAVVGWDNNKAAIGGDLQVLFSDHSLGIDKKYTYTAYLPGNGGMKFPTIAGDWDTTYGVSGNTLVPENGGGDGPGPETSGVYTIAVDLDDLSLAVTKYEGEIKTYNAIGIIGTAVKGWDEDVKMTKVAEHVWVITKIDLQAGELKFRANSKWDTSWGDDTPDFPFGITGGDANIPIDDAGEYFVSFNSLTGHYVIIPTSALPAK